MAELADAPDLGSGGLPVQVQVLSPAPNKKGYVLVAYPFLFYKGGGLEVGAVVNESPLDSQSRE